MVGFIRTTDASFLGADRQMGLAVKLRFSDKTQNLFKNLKLFEIFRSCLIFFVLARCCHNSVTKINFPGNFIFFHTKSSKEMATLTFRVCNGSAAG